MLDRRGFATIAELENYSNATVSQLLYSTLECLDIRDVQADHVASHIGKSVGLVNHIRSIPFHAAKERVLIPNDLLILHKVSQQEILRGTTSGEHSGLKSVVFDLAAQANSHLLSARKGNGTVKNEAKVAFLAAVAVDQFLQRLQLVDFNIFHKRMASGSGLLPLKMWWYKMRKLY